MTLILGVVALVILFGVLSWVLYLRQRPTIELPPEPEPSMTFHKVIGTHYRMRLPDRLKLTMRGPDER